MIILYGVQNSYTDITSNFSDKSDIFIPLTDLERSVLFRDPMPGILKEIVIIDDNNRCLKIPHGNCYYNTFIGGKLFHENKKTINVISTEERLKNLHDELTILHGNKYDEWPEQFLSVFYIKPENKVLEIGGNIGRNSCIISKLLNDSKNLLVFESSKDIGKHLEENRKINGLSFNIETKALSNSALMQKDWICEPLKEPLPNGFTKVETMSYHEFREKWGGDFDFLVADCEGALFSIFNEMPEIINGIKTVILENDFLELEKGVFVHDFLRDRGFKVLCEIQGGWGYFYNCFYQVWKKE